MSASDKLDLTQFEGHAEGLEYDHDDGIIYDGDKPVCIFGEIGFQENDWNPWKPEFGPLFAKSPVLLAKLREAVGLLRTANAFIIPKRNGEESEMQHRVNAFLDTITTGDQTHGE